MRAENFLKHALGLAEKRRGFCAPNPSVGAVVVKDNTIISEGFHWAAGHPHAEVEALKNLDSKAEDAILYVTLEPCCHAGKTPACTDLIFQKKIKKVVYGLKDPNPLVSGKGAAWLNAHGIDCEYYYLEEIEKFYESYVFWWGYRRPFVTAKLALSLDGKIAGEKGARVEITGESFAQWTHQQRKHHDAILTTAKTILNDNPRLDVRLENENISKPIFILDSHLKTSLEANIFQTAESVHFFYDKTLDKKKVNPYLEKGAECIPVVCDERGLSLEEILAILGDRGYHDVWVEAGGQLFESLVLQKQLQKAYIGVGLKWLGSSAQTAFVRDIFSIVKTWQWVSLNDDVFCELRF